jgi:two-component system, response regulator YesN
MKKRKAPAINKDDRSLLEQFVKEIEARPGKRYSINEVIQQLGMGRTKFSYVFKELYGESFHRWLVRMRMEHAKSLLSSTDLPLKAVGISLGYRNFKHFLTAFKKEQGETPSQFKQH